LLEETKGEIKDFRNVQFCGMFFINNYLLLTL